MLIFSSLVVEEFYLYHHSLFLHLFIVLGAMQFRDVCRPLSLGEAGERPPNYKKISLTATIATAKG